ncbi:MAG TPA: DoxX family membrane protein, partial [Pirellulales bacterium]
MSRHWQPLVQLVGRACLGLVFLSSAATRLRHFHERSGGLALDGAPEAGVLLGVWIALAIAGGLTVALGWRTRWGLALLALSTVLGQWIDGKSTPATFSLGLSSGAAN